MNIYGFPKKMLFKIAIFVFAMSSPTGATTMQDEKKPTSEHEEVVYSPAQDATIPASELSRFEKDAMMGSPSAARKLAMFHGMVKLNNKEKIYWLTIAAENGDREARYDLALALSNEQDSMSLIRARYWFERIVKDGPDDLAKHAEFGLQNLGIIEKGLLKQKNR